MQDYRRRTESTESQRAARPAVVSRARAGGALAALLAACAGALAPCAPADAAARPTAAGTPFLDPGQELTGGQSLTDGTMAFVVGTDGNLVLTDAGHAVWATGTTGHSGSYLLMQGDGNLVEYSPTGSVVWTTNTYNHPGSYLTLGQFGYLTVGSASGTYWETPLPNTDFSQNQSDVLFAGQTQGAPGQEMLDFSSKYSLYEYDGWLEEYVNGTNNLVWSVGSYYPSGAYAIMQSDGNFVLYHGSTAVWSTNTGGHPNYGNYLHLQSDGNLVVYSNYGVAQWSNGK